MAEFRLDLTEIPSICQIQAGGFSGETGFQGRMTGSAVYTERSWRRVRLEERSRTMRNSLFTTRERGTVRGTCAMLVRAPHKLSDKIPAVKHGSGVRLTTAPIAL